jgi:hypothetical protein
MNSKQRLIVGAIRLKPFLRPREEATDDELEFTTSDSSTRIAARVHMYSTERYMHMVYSNLAETHSMLLHVTKVKR